MYVCSLTILLGLKLWQLPGCWAFSAKTRKLQAKAEHIEHIWVDFGFVCCLKVRKSRWWFLN